MTIKPIQWAPKNPYQQLITVCDNDQRKIQDAYQKHRLGRNAQSRAQIMDPNFRKWQFDEILHNVLEAEQGLTQFVDPRHNLSLWARPPRHIRELVYDIQQEIAAVAGSCLWLTPPENLHMTTLEMMPARTAPEVDDLVALLQENAPLQELVNYTQTHHARLGRPIVSYDASALALSFIPIAESGDGEPFQAGDSSYTYHHLRSDLYDMVTQAGCHIVARYNVPSAHLTIARFTVPVGGDQSMELESLCRRAARIVETIEDINLELSSNEWKRFGHPSRGEWTVGQERGLELNKGMTWYGTGNAILTGEGIP